MNGLLMYIAESGPPTSIQAGPVLHLGGIAITNSILYGWISVVVMFVLLTWAARKVTVRPKGGAVQFVEAGVEFIVSTMESAFEDKSRARKYMPFFVTLFFFLLINNWLGLVPGVGEAVHIGETPLLRPFTADFNGTLAAAVVTMAMIYWSSMREFGSVRRYFRHFFAGSPKNPLYFFIGILEMFSNLMRIASLSLRLFLNIAIGEIIIGVFGYLGQLLAPATIAPFFLFDLFEGALQAFIFTVLSIMYLAAATNEAGHEAHAGREVLTEGSVPETIDESPAHAGAVS